MGPHFVAGDMVRPTRLAVRAVAAGRQVGERIDGNLRGVASGERRTLFNCRIGAVDGEEIEQMLQLASRDEETFPYDAATMPIDGVSVWTLPARRRGACIATAAGFNHADSSTMRKLTTPNRNGIHHNAANSRLIANTGTSSSNRASAFPAAFVSK